MAGDEESLDGTQGGKIGVNFQCRKSEKAKQKVSIVGHFWRDNIV